MKEDVEKLTIFYNIILYPIHRNTISLVYLFDELYEWNCFFVFFFSFGNTVVLTFMPIKQISFRPDSFSLSDGSLLQCMDHA